MAAEDEVLASLQRRVASASNREKLAQLTSEIGHALAAGRLLPASTALLARSLSGARLHREPFEDGYLQALSQLVAAVSAATADDEDRRALASAIRRTDALVTIVRALDANPASPAMLARALGESANDGRVSRYLAKLEELGVVEPSPSPDKRERRRQLTPRGHRVARELAQREALEPAWTGEFDAAKLTDAIVGMVHLTVRCRDVALPELAACVGRPDPYSEHLARAFAAASEQRGLLDITSGGRCVWDRNHSRESWSSMLAEYGERMADLRAAFDAVPRGFDLWTDAVEDWRDALVRAGVDGVRDICSHFMGMTAQDPNAPAVVVDDETVAAKFAAHAGPHQKVFVARQHRGQVLVMPL